MRHFPGFLAGSTLLMISIVPAFTLAAEQSAGQQEYEARCAMCHGPTGKGDGWLSKHLTYPVASLARLKKNNSGVFPFDRTYEVIDGRKEVQMHGPRNMPVWGAIYREESDSVYESNLWRSHLGEGFVRARILALIEYISQFQE